MSVCLKYLSKKIVDSMSANDKDEISRIKHIFKTMVKKIYWNIIVHVGSIVACDNIFKTKNKICANTKSTDQQVPSLTFVKVFF